MTNHLVERHALGPVESTAERDAGRAVRLAMWSGPRNLSTALMRSFGQRTDCVVWDEPLYAHFLQVTQDRRHPGFDATLAAHEADLQRVVEAVFAPLPIGKSVLYQKQMAHHLIPEVQREWTDDLTNCLLIRDPAHVLASLDELLPDPVPADTGLPQQVELFERAVARTGGPPPIIDAADVLADPGGLLTKLCGAIGIPFDEGMLSWPPGLRDTDGSWAPQWYGKVVATTTFTAPTRRHFEVPAPLTPVLDACRPLYDRLHEARLR